MMFQLGRVRLKACGAALLVLAGCGGGRTDGTGSAAATTRISTTVVDGPIGNATVCLDKNGNGVCDADEAQGHTDAAGRVTFAVPSADAGKYPLIAVVGLDATDADNGAVPVRYTLSAPKDNLGVVSPLTTLVQQTVAGSGGTSAEAARSLQAATGITSSLFDDFTKATVAPVDGSIDPATVARMLVVTTQQQTTAVAGAAGSVAIDGAVITQADLDRAAQKKVLELLPAMITALSDPAVQAATTRADREAVLQAAAAALISGSGLSAASVATHVAVNKQIAAVSPAALLTPGAGISLVTLNYTDASNFYEGVLGYSRAQNTPDAAQTVKAVDRRTRSVGGDVARWGSGPDPWRQADLHWNGNAWVSCPLNFEQPTSARDAQGNSGYNYCDGLETGNNTSAVFDVGGRSMADVYAQVRLAGYTNLSIADPTLLGSAQFPAGSALHYHSLRPLSVAFSYYPGSSRAVGQTSVVSQYGPAVSGGGDAVTQAGDAGCNSAEARTPGFNSGSLDAMIAAMTGTPCTFAQDSIVRGGASYPSDMLNEWWGNSTVDLGVVPALVSTEGTPAGYYSGNAQLRVAFRGAGINALTYYLCMERAGDGSTRNCSVIGTGAYNVASYGDARVMTLINPPAQASSLTYTRVFIERSGLVYAGTLKKPIVVNQARLNTTGATAFLAQLGLAAEDPSMPLALTAGSYEGIWDLSNPFDAAGGTTLYLSGAGVWCIDKRSNAGIACSIVFTDASTGAFTYTDAQRIALGTFSFMAGTGSGRMHDPSAMPMDGSFSATRR